MGTGWDAGLGSGWSSLGWNPRRTLVRGTRTWRTQGLVVDDIGCIPADHRRSPITITLDGIKWKIVIIVYLNVLDFYWWWWNCLELCRHFNFGLHCTSGEGILHVEVQQTIIIESQTPLASDFRPSTRTPPHLPMSHPQV
jgi:hypothetical protein